MVSSILIILFSIVACLESAAYGFYELQVNKNKVRWSCFIYFFYCADLFFLLLFILLLNFNYLFIISLIDNFILASTRDKFCYFLPQYNKYVM